MAFFDPRLHPATLSEQDLETLLLFGVERVLLVADSTAHPATPAGLFTHFDALLGPQVTRCERAGLRASVALGVPPRVVPHRGLGQVLDALPGYFGDPHVVALGQLGLSAGDAREEEALLEQLALAQRYRRPALVSAPGREKERITKRLLSTLLRGALPPSRILLDGAVGRTVRAVRELGFWAGLTLHPDHLTVERAVQLVAKLGPTRLVLDSAAGDGSSDLLSLGRAAHRLAKAGLSSRVVRAVTRDNATALFGP